MRRTQPLHRHTSNRIARQATQRGVINDLHQVQLRQRDQVLLLEFGEGAAHRFPDSPRLVGDIAAAHRQHHGVADGAGLGGAGSQTQQEMRQPFAGLQARQHRPVSCAVASSMLARCSSLRSSCG